LSKADADDLVQRARTLGLDAEMHPD
jgi:hypothetical protein